MPWDGHNVDRDTNHIRNRAHREDEIIRILDLIGFNWTVFIAVSAGFFACSYTIFSSSIISPALQYVYPQPQGDNFGDPGQTIDLVTIGATIPGMLIFGHLADRMGRKRLYGLELFTIIIGTVGMIQASAGYMNINLDDGHALDVFGATAAWRAIQGLGIGAEYPLSAIIAAEFASTQTRGTLMAAVFASQSVGRILAYVVELAALTSVPNDQNDHKVHIDQVWRLVVGIGAVPALIAIGLRLTIPETPRYYGGINKDLNSAARSVVRVGGQADDLQSIHSDILPTGRSEENTTSWFSSAWEYLFKNGSDKWRRLLGVSLMWFLLDLVFYGLDLDGPLMLNYLYLSAKPDYNATCTIPASTPGAAPSFRPETLTLQNHVVTTYTLENQKIATATLDQNVVTTLTQVLAAPTSMATATQVAKLPSWNQDAGNPCATIKDVLWTSAIHTLELSSVAALVGALVCIVIINYIPRRRLMAITSAGLALLLFASGFAVWKTAETEYHKVTMVFFALIQFLLNVGPNTVVFIIAAESFPTVFRGTFYGVAAASGKVGALIIRVVVQKTYNHKLPTMGLFFGFCAASLLMVVIALFDGFLVDVQKTERPLLDVEKRSKIWWPKQLRNKTLEEIAPNPRQDRNSRISWDGA